MRRLFPVLFAILALTLISLVGCETKKLSLEEEAAKADGGLRDRTANAGEGRANVDGDELKKDIGD